MQREPATPVRRMKHCRVMVRPWQIPTLIAYPPPPPERAGVRAPVVRRVEALATPRSLPRPARRRGRDCIFIPDMDMALQFIEARRRAADIDDARDRAALPALPTLLDTPVVLGLLLTVLPPLAVTMIWSTPRFSRTAQMALTLYGALVTVLLAAIAIAALT
jgi:hypothetical protein